MSLIAAQRRRQVVTLSGSAHIFCKKRSPWLDFDAVFVYTPGMASHSDFIVTDEQLDTLRTWIKAHNTPQQVVLRCRIVLLAVEGLSNRQIAKRLGISKDTAGLWRKRFVDGGPAALRKIKPGRGRKPTIPQATIDAIVHDTKHTTPPGQTHWSCRTMADRHGVSPATVQRIWSARGLKPHLVRTFKLSNDPDFEAKLVDVVGLYLNPPERAVVLCVDEKSQIQALDRTQPSLPMKKGRAGTMTHDYKRNGTTTLFAALEAATGKVIGQCLDRHRHQEFIKFLKTLDREYPKDLDLHLIVDNYATHKHAEVKKWLANHPRFHLHFIPTSSSWLNLVERFFRDITDKAIRRGVFTSVTELTTAIEDYLTAHNDDPHPFVWTAAADAILEKVRRGRIALDAQSG
jgi:transposase